MRQSLQIPFLAILTLLCTQACNQPGGKDGAGGDKGEHIIVPMKEMLLRDGIAYHGRKLKPFTGQANEYFPFKQDPQPLSVTRQFKEGKLHGMVTFFFNNGQKRSEIPYENGIKQGEATNWYMTGEVQWKRSFNQNQLEGDSIRYNQKGEVLTHIIFNKGQIAKAIK